jgi:hypothetical protein
MHQGRLARGIIRLRKLSRAWDSPGHQRLHGTQLKPARLSNMNMDRCQAMSAPTRDVPVLASDCASSDGTLDETLASNAVRPRSRPAEAPAKRVSKVIPPSAVHHGRAIRAGKNQGLAFVRSIMPARVLARNRQMLIG